ncbi:MAG: hypothetical protein AUK44_08820 [Porphyromonadaceae bacterium CG2_30_38_12]|nr:MAG: hypothetical protein AUK44_08820 [Porphyromonadaceae bacterium CG2_30_38_12]
MKKLSIFTIVTMALFLVTTSCSNYKAKTVTMSSMNDSLNYTLGLYNGKGIKDYYMKSDSSDKAIAALIDAVDKAYKTEISKDELYKLGLQIGGSLKQQKKQGLMGDSTLVMNQELVMQGLVNALNGFGEGMKPTEAEQYIQLVMSEIQAKKMAQQAPPAPAAQPQAVDTVSVQ